MSETTLSKIAHLFTGGFLGDGREVTIPAPPLSPERYRVLIRERLQNKKASALYDEQCARDLAEALEMGMARSDLRRVAAEEQAAAHPLPMPERVIEKMVRVRVIDGFSHEWRGIPYSAPQHSIIDIPLGYARAAEHLFEIVAADTPLLHVQPTPEMPR